jgi:hypothetical protein
MAPNDKPVTKADLNAAIQSIQRLIENELKHQTEDVAELKGWRDGFVAEDGPWRSMDNRVRALEYLARSIKWVIAILTPIAIWAIMEMIKAAVIWMQSNP